MEVIISNEKSDKSCSTADEEFRVDMEDYVSSSEWKMKQIENILAALINNKFVSLNRPKSHSIVSSIYSNQEKKRRSRHKHCHNLKHHHHNHHHHGHHHHHHHHSEHPEHNSNADEMDDLTRVHQWSSELSDPQLYNPREGVKDGKIRRKKRKRRKRRRAGQRDVVLIDPEDLPKRAKWTIIITAGLLLLTCMLLVGITLRMAPIIDQMVRNQNEELLNSLNRQELNESMYLLMGGER